MIDAAVICVFVTDPLAVAGRLNRARRIPPERDGDLLTVTGYVGTLRARLRGDRLILRGSLPTYMGLTSPLSLAQFHDARQRLEAALGVDVGDAHVWGLELTADLVLPRDPSLYLPLLLRRKDAQRVVYEWTSVAFRTGKLRWLTFYSSGAARASSGLPIPPGHVLRVEVKFKKRLQRQLKTDGPLTIADIERPQIWMHLAARWQEEYDAVVKAPGSIAPDWSQHPSKALGAIAIHSMGLGVVEARIRETFRSGSVPENTMRTRLKWVRDRACDPAHTTDDGRLAELDGAAARAFARMQA